MTLGQGQIFASGIAILLKGPNDALAVPDGVGPVKYLHFVDGGGNTIVPTYEADGLDAASGKIAGARLVVANSTDVAALQAEVAGLQVQMAALQATVLTLFGGRWPVGNVQTTDYTPQIGEYVRVDMTDKVSPDVVTITLPEATPANLGRRVMVAEISTAGVSGGAVLRIAAQPGQEFDTGYTTGPINVAGQGARWTFVSMGDGWSVEDRT